MKTESARARRGSTRHVTKPIDVGLLESIVTTVPH